MPQYLCFFPHFYGDQATQRDFNKNFFFYDRSNGVATSYFIAVILTHFDVNFDEERERVLDTVKVRYRLAMTVLWETDWVLTLMM